MGETASSYRPQLDGLRAFAVLAVLHHHFWHGGPFGQLGVRLFFVLSGFLITGVLLDARHVTGPITTFDKFKVFYLRRGLRIFPPYYLALIVGLIGNLGDVRQAFPWHALYASNILFTITGQWGPNGHLWTLSVEEQFYLLWPFVIILAPIRSLPYIVIATAVSSIVFRQWYFNSAAEGPAIWVATPGALDAFAMGSILSLWLRGSSRPVAGRLGWLAIFATGGVYVFYDFASPEQRYVVGQFLQLIPMALLVGGAYSGFGTIGRYALENPVAIFVGKISYGLYLYHIFVWNALLKAATYFNHPGWFQQGPTTFVTAGLATFAVSTASWHMLEKPVARLKKRFSYGVARV